MDKLTQTHDSLIANWIAMFDYFKAHPSKSLFLSLENFQMATLFEIAL